jgi:hypothetical protein
VSVGGAEVSASEIKVWTTVLDQLRKPRGIFSYFNLVEYALPAAVLLVCVVIDVRILAAVNPAALLPSGWGSLGASIALLVVVGWLLYASRFYSLFPGYAERKRRLRVDIASRVLKHRPLSDSKKVLLGKYLYQQFWHTVDEKTRQQALTFHTAWVALVHICNALMLSAIFAGTLGVYREWPGRPHPPGVFQDFLFLEGGHLVFWTYFFIAARKNLVRSNFFVLDAANRSREKLFKRLPPDLDDYIKNI